MKRSASLFYIIKQNSAGLGCYLVPLFLFGLSLGKAESFILINSFSGGGHNKLLQLLTEISGGMILSAIFVLIFARTRPVGTILAVAILFIAWCVCITLINLKYLNI